ncbi:hypothetical protein RN001_007483 [Aquatica leii]|uniref:Uncharacterized protein n=1 Tax=Aquatica leii TaxID=1421715 RepID=A0AAN7PY72_9COLE|nr:hypothetical protein RN001_007483 [Aquatica leii]
MFKILFQIFKILASLCFISVVELQRIPYQYSNLHQVPIVKLSYEPNPDGSYNYNYETGHGIVAQQRGYVKNLGNPQTEAQVVEGSYSYIGPDGIQYTVNYVADENGFHAQGAHIPKPPPVPEAIQRSIAFNSAYPEISNIHKKFKF